MKSVQSMMRQIVPYMLLALLYPSLVHADGLRDPTVAAKLCANRDGGQTPTENPIEQIHTLKFDHAALPLKSYDEALGLLPVDVYRDVALADAYVMRVTAPVGVAFELSRSRAADIRAAYELDQLDVEMKVVSSRYADQSKPPCSKENETTVIHVTVLAAQMVHREEGPVAHFETELWRAIRSRRSQSVKAYLTNASPVVEITALASVSDGRKSVTISDASLRSKINKILHGCYTRSLARNQREQGAVVFQIVPSTRKTTILVSTLQDDAIASCATDAFGDAFSELPIPKIKMTAVFKLVEHGPL